MPDDKLPREIERKDLRVGDVFRGIDRDRYTVTRIDHYRILAKFNASVLQGFLLDGPPVTLIRRAEPEPRFVVGRKYDVNTLPVGAVWESGAGYHWTCVGNGYHRRQGLVAPVRVSERVYTLVSLPDYRCYGCGEIHRTESRAANCCGSLARPWVGSRDGTWADPRVTLTPRQCRCPFEARSRMRRLSTCDVCDGALPEPPVLLEQVTFSREMSTEKAGEHSWYAHFGCVSGEGPTKASALRDLESVIGVVVETADDE